MKNKTQDRDYFAGLEAALGREAALNAMHASAISFAQHNGLEINFTGRPAEAKKSPAYGFQHLFSVVTDGCGQMVSLDHAGRRIAEVTVTMEESESPAPFAELARLTAAVLNGDAEPIDPDAVQF